MITADRSKLVELARRCDELIEQNARLSRERTELLGMLAQQHARSPEPAPEPEAKR